MSPVLHAEEAGLKEKVRDWFAEKFVNIEKAATVQYGLYKFKNKEWEKWKGESLGNEVILLIHGLDDPGILWDQLAEVLVEKKLTLLRLSYPNDQAISKSTSFLINQLQVIQKASTKRVKIIAHSMGGIVTRDALTNKKYYAGQAVGHESLPSVAQVITIGTPYYGSHFAKFQIISELGEQFTHIVKGDAQFLGFFYDGVGEAAEDLQPDSDYLTELNSRALPKGVRYTIIAGNMGLDASKKLEKTTSEWEVENETLKKGLDKMKGYFEKSSKTIGDGVVTLASARLKGVEDFVVVDGNHISMLTNLKHLQGPPSAFPVIMDRLDQKSFQDEKSEIADDEFVVLYNTHARLSEDGKEWIIPIHGSIFEPEEDSKWRNLGLKALAKSIGLKKDELKNDIFLRKSRQFLVDNERGKTISIKVGDQKVKLKKSTANGHFYGQAHLKADALKDKNISYRALTKQGDERVFSGWSRPLQEEGISIISDIDDTIKLSDVLDKKALLRNTFLKEFAAVPGMAEQYRLWYEQGAAFHYVSSSPWQLYSELNQFMQNSGFPQGQMHLKYFRIKDTSMLSLFKSPMKTKVPGIEEIMNQFPKRKYILVGDSGEKDPEVYGEVYRKHPNKIEKIYIRKAPGDETGKERFEKAFAKVPEIKWLLFNDVKEIDKNK